MTSDVARQRIFFFNRYVYPDHSATSQLLTDLATHLASQGAEVILVGSRQRYDDPNSALPASELVHGFEVVRLGGTRFGRASLLGRLADYLSYTASAAWLTVRRVRADDVLVALTDPPIFGSVLALLGRWRGARCVHWLQDIFPEVAEILLGRLWSGWRMAPLRWLRDLGLRIADCVVVISPGMAAKVASRGVDVSRIKTIENWVDDVTIRPIAADANPLRASWGLTGKLVVGYSGNLGRAHDWQTMLEAATLLRDRSDIRFLLIGGGHGQRAFAAAAAQRSLMNVDLRPYQPREILALSLAVPDIHWLSLLPGLEGLIFPSKLYGILAVGRPSLLIGDPDSELAKVLDRAESGMTVRPGDANAAALSISSLADDPERLKTMGESARKHLDASLSRQAALDQWSAVLTADAT